jgi:hypothetical protein
MTRYTDPTPFKVLSALGETAEPGNMGMTAATRSEHGDRRARSYLAQLDNYADTPKPVYAALAYSLAARLSEDDPAAVNALLADEWLTLYACGVIRQKPR